MATYFAALGFPCPPYSNPCDYYVDLTTVSFTTAEEQDRTEHTVRELVAQYARQEAWPNLPVATVTAASAATTAARALSSEADLASRSARAVNDADDADVAVPGFLTQFLLLAQRSLRHQVKDWDTLVVELVQSLLTALVVGSVFWVRVCARAD